MTTLQPTGGINNRSKDINIPKDERGSPLFVRNAVNVNISPEGVFSSREGIGQVWFGAGCRDGFSCPRGSFFRQGTVIMKFNGPNDAEVIAEGITGTQVSWFYDHATGNIFFSDSLNAKKILPSWVVRRWGIVPPATAPILSGTGHLGAGTYSCCYTYLGEDGTESGASPVRSVSEGRLVSGLSDSPDRQVVGKKVYLTTPNGSEYYFAGMAPVGQSSLLVNFDHRSGEQLPTKGKTCPPAGHIIRRAGARMMIADKSRIWFSTAFSSDLISIGEFTSGDNEINFWQFPEAISVMEPVEGGIWVVSDQTYFVSGKDLTNSSPMVVDQETAVFGTSYVDEGKAYWFGSKGEVVAEPGGGIRYPQYDNVAAPISETGATANMVNDGNKNKITILNDGTANKLQDKDWAIKRQNYE